MKDLKIITVDDLHSTIHSFIIDNDLKGLLKFLGKNKLFSKIASKYADQGLSI